MVIILQPDVWRKKRRKKKKNCDYWSGAPDDGGPSVRCLEWCSAVMAEIRLDEGIDDKSDKAALSNEVEDTSEESDIMELEEGKPLINTASDDHTSTVTTRRKTRWQSLCQSLCQRAPTFLSYLVGEFVGTFVLVLVTITAVATAVVVPSGHDSPKYGAHSGLWQVAIISGLGVAMGTYISMHISNGHLNPAVTLSFAIVRWRVFSWKRVVPYWCMQLLAAFCAGAVLHGFYFRTISKFENDMGFDRGSKESRLSAMLFGEYFPNPAMYGNDGTNDDAVPLVEAFFVEFWGTLILVFVIFSLTHPSNCTIGRDKDKKNNGSAIVPMLVGLTIAMLIGIYAPLTQVGINPARDFGPRIFACIAGWGKVAIPGPRNGFWVYIVAPLIGGPVGGILHDCLIGNLLRFSKRHIE